MISGVRDYADAAVDKVADDHAFTATRDDLIALGLAAGQQVPPGTGAYSTTNYLILGKVMETLTGKTPEDLVNAVFAQAGMMQSLLLSQATTLPPPASHGYLGPLGALELAQMGRNLDASLDVTDWNFDWGKEGGGAYSVIGDLATWGGTCLGNSLLPAQMVAVREKTHTIKGVGAYGLGIISFGNDWYGHGGQTVGWESDVRCNAKTGAVIALMTNSTGGTFNDDALLQSLFPDLVTG